MCICLRVILFDTYMNKYKKFRFFDNHLFMKLGINY